MKKHLSYLKYVLRHKWYVLQECRRHGILWRGITHDLSKFLPSEWFPYVDFFHAPSESAKEANKNRFLEAVRKHYSRNPHHWEHWVRRTSLWPGITKVIPEEMPEEYALEMYCDWIGAGRAIHGSNDIHEWYAANKERMCLHHYTRSLIEEWLGSTH